MNNAQEIANRRTLSMKEMEKQAAERPAQAERTALSTPNQQSEDVSEPSNTGE